MPTGFQSPERLAEVMAIVTCWQARERPVKARGFYTPAELHAAMGLTTRTLSAALTLLGWHRVTVWSREGDTRIWRGEICPDGRRRGTRKVLQTYWVAPGCTMERPARGRPRWDLSWLFSTR
ncbi:hypothetical protein B0G77_4356 [Paraburkholderia sp. BL10I2N1]|nr:hypothetical protein B0G77_4356 [Paraburkholderia sp. BL10I2N1]